MADTARAADEEHGDRHDLGHHHGVVASTGGEPLNRQARGRNCLCANSACGVPSGGHVPGLYSAAVLTLLIVLAASAMPFAVPAAPPPMSTSTVSEQM